MDIVAKVKKKSPMVINRTIKINKEIEADIAAFEKEFPDVDIPKLFRMGLYLAMNAVREGAGK